MLMRHARGCFGEATRDITAKKLSRYRRSAKKTVVMIADEGRADAAPSWMIDGVFVSLYMA